MLPEKKLGSYTIDMYHTLGKAWDSLKPHGIVTNNHWFMEIQIMGDHGGYHRGWCEFAGWMVPLWKWFLVFVGEKFYGYGPDITHITHGKIDGNSCSFSLKPDHRKLESTCNDDHRCVSRGMDGLLGVAGMIIDDYGMDHSLMPYVNSTSKSYTMVITIIHLVIHASTWLSVMLIEWLSYTIENRLDRWL